MVRLARLCAVFFLFASFLAATAAHADTIASFTFSGTPVANNDPNTVSGNITIDTTTGAVQSVSFLASGLALQSGVESQSGPQLFVGATNSSLSFSAGSLINFNGASFNLRTPNDLYVGQTSTGTPVVTPPVSAVTPEPSGMVLLATGLIGLSLLLNRRLRSSESVAISVR